MKKLLPGLVCAGLLVSGWALPSAAQQPPPPPAQGQTPPVEEPQPQSPQERLPLPPLPKVEDVRMPGERGFWVGALGWSSNPRVSLIKGHAAPTDYPGTLDLRGKQGINMGVEIGFAAGLHNSLRVSYFEAKSSGSTTAAEDMVLWNRFYNKGDYITTDYRMRNVKVSFEYLTWPYPVKSSRFRLRSLWQLQYVTVVSRFDAPLNKTTDDNGNPLTDANGELVAYDAKGSAWYMLPSVGLGAQHYIKPNFNIEMNASGFAIPRHFTVWDVDAAANVRIGHYEIRAGVKGFHFQTSPLNEFWHRGTVWGPFVGIRLHSDSAK